MVPKPNNKERRKNRRYSKESLEKPIHDILGKEMM